MQAGGVGLRGLSTRAFPVGFLSKIGQVGNQADAACPAKPQAVIHDHEAMVRRASPLTSTMDEMGTGWRQR